MKFLRSAENRCTLIILGIVALAIACFVLPGCNTISGFATDVKAVSDGTRQWMANN